MPSVTKRRRLSRKGCVSCKRLKIKCDEAKPACEYCVHRGRECIYPAEVPNEARDMVVAKDSANWATSGDLRVFSFNSAQVQLNVTRFEYRLMHFFHDHCIPIFTYNNHDRADQIWRHHLPSFFGLSPLMRQAVYAFASLNLWPVSNFRAILEEDETYSGSSYLTPLEYNLDDLSHVLERLSIDSEPETSILDRTNVFFDNVVRMSATHIQEASARGIQYSDVATIYLSTTLTFTYIGLHPHCIMPLVDFENNPPSDLLSYSRSVHNLMRNAPPNVYQALLSKLTEFQFIPCDSVKYHIIAALNAELEREYSSNSDTAELDIDDLLASDHTLAEMDFDLDAPSPNYKSTLEPSNSPSSSGSSDTAETPSTYAYEFDSKTSMEVETFRQAISVFEICFHTSIVNNFPIPLYKLLPFLTEEFSTLARAKNPFALRLLFLYCLFCIYGQFYIQRQNNLWAQYVRWFVDNQTLSPFDMILYDYIMLQDTILDKTKTTDGFTKLDGLFKHNPHSAYEPFDAFGAFKTDIGFSDESLFPDNAM